MKKIVPSGYPGAWFSSPGTVKRAANAFSHHCFSLSLKLKQSFMYLSYKSVRYVQYDILHPPSLQNQADQAATLIQFCCLLVPDFLAVIKLTHL